jgi:cytidine deaminase
VTRAELEARAIAAARNAHERAYSPYSGLRVGAALCDINGAIAVGCNVENAAYGSTMCAEHGAVMAAVVLGMPAPVLLAIVTNGRAPAPPCGTCRQVLVELAPDVEIISVAGDGADQRQERWRLTDLLPHAFLPSSLDTPT